MGSSTAPCGWNISLRIVTFLLLLLFRAEVLVALTESDELTLQDLTAEESTGAGLSSDEFVGEGGNFGAGASSSWHGSSQRGEKKISFTLEHELGSGFKLAGELTARMRQTITGGKKFSKTASLSRTTFSTQDEALFQRLVERGGYYKIRAPSNLLKESTEFVIASISARCLAAASFQEALELHVDQGGYLIGLSLKPKEGKCSFSAPKTIPTKFDFKSVVTFHHPKVAPKILQLDVPGGKGTDPKMKGVNAMSADPSATGDNADAPPKTFWQKYWLYIMAGGMLFMNILTTLSAMPEEQPGPAGGARAGGGGGAPRRR